MHFAKKCNVLKIKMTRESGRLRTTFGFELRWLPFEFEMVLLKAALIIFRRIIAAVKNFY